MIKSKDIFLQMQEECNNILLQKYYYEYYNSFQNENCDNSL
jgi:hypothetical protein